MWTEREIILNYHVVLLNLPVGPRMAWEMHLFWSVSKAEVLLQVLGLRLSVLCLDQSYVRESGGYRDHTLAVRVHYMAPGYDIFSSRWFFLYSLCPKGQRVTRVWNLSLKSLYHTIFMWALNKPSVAFKLDPHIFKSVFVFIKIAIYCWCLFMRSPARGRWPFPSPIEKEFQFAWPWKCLVISLNCRKSLSASLIM